MNKAKFRFLSRIAVAGIMLLSTCVGAVASDRGKMKLGVMGGFASQNTSGYVGVDFQYNFSNHVRIAPDVVYVFPNKEKSSFLIDVDIHIPFRVARGLALYPIAGAQYSYWNYRHHDNYSRIGLNAGAGLELYITPSLKVSLQGKYSFAKDASGCYAGLGIGYIF